MLLPFRGGGGATGVFFPLAVLAFEIGAARFAAVLVAVVLTGLLGLGETGRSVSITSTEPNLMTLHASST